MDSTIGQIVYIFKDSQSSAMRRTGCHTSDVSKRVAREEVKQPSLSVVWIPPVPSKFKAAFHARIKLARQGAGLTQEEIAQRMGIRQDKYAKYETRSLMPHHLLSRFSELTREPLDKLLRDPR